MVPFPGGVDPESKEWALQAMSKLCGNPDGHGLLTPPMREEIKKSMIIGRATNPVITDKAISSRAAVEHGIARYYLRLISHGLGGGNPLGDMAMRRIERRAKKKDYYGTYLYPISEMLKDEEIPKIQEEIRNAWKGDVPPDDLEKAVNIVPDIIKVAKILGDVIDKHHKVNKKGLTAYHAFIDFINHPTPARLVKTLADNPQEALEAIYKLHVKLYHLLPEFFERESGIEHMIPASRREQIRQEALRELEGIIKEEKKIEEQMRGKPIATFEDEALAREFASMKGGQVVKTPEGKYAVVFGGGQRPSAPAQKRHWVEEVLGIPADQIKKHPETGYEYVEKDGKIIVLPHDDPRKLGLKGPDHPAGNLESGVIPDIIRFSRKPAEELRAYGQVFKEIVDGIHSGRIRNMDDIQELALKHANEASRKGYKYAADLAKVLASVFDKRMRIRFPQDFTMQHLAAEYSFGAIALYDAADLTEEILKNLERHGIDSSLPEREVKKEVSRKVKDMLKGKYLGFHKR